MAKGSTKKRDWQYHSKMYAIPGGSMKAQNVGHGMVEVEFRFGPNVKRKLAPGELHIQSFLGYCELWFKSVDGDYVEVKSNGKISKKGVKIWKW